MKQALLALPFLFSFAGCLDDAPDSLDSTEQAVGTAIPAVHLCTTGACSNIPISSSTNVCWISGLFGDLADNGSVNLHNTGTQWVLDIKSPFKNNIRVFTECVKLAGKIAPVVTWNSQSPNNAWFPGDANTRCYLTQFTANNTLAFQNFNSNARIIDTGGFNYQITDVMPTLSDVTMAMQCFDGTLVSAVVYGNGSTSGASGTLLADPKTQACGLTGLGGQLNRPDPNNGIAVLIAGAVWGWEASGLTGIWGDCFQ